MKEWIHTLSNKDRESFLEFCKKASSPIQIYLFSRFLGFQGTVVECNEWSTKEFKKRNFNIVLETEIDNMQIDINKLRDAIDMGIVKQDMGAARIAMLQKELRGAIKQIEDKKILQDKQGLILAGADRALREMLSIFRDDPIEGPLQEASMGVWTKILQEES
jgi:hypothetical protein